MKTEHIKYFLEVVRQGSINKAANSLHLNHQHLGKIITSIEDEIGVQCLTRNRVGIFCTDIGTRAIELMQQMDSLYDELISLSSDDRFISEQRTVSCMVFARTNHENQSKAILELRKRFPKVSIELQEAHTDKIIEAVAYNVNCIGNILSYSFPSATNLPEECFVYYSMEVEPVVIIGKENPLGLKYKDISIKTLCQYPIALYCPYEINMHHFYELLTHYDCRNIRYVISNLQSYKEILLNSNVISLGFKPKNKFDGKLLLSNSFAYIPIRERINAESQWIINKEAVNDTLICNYLNYILSYQF